MNTKKLLNLALEGIDTLGFRLDDMGITSKLNRHPPRGLPSGKIS